MDRKEVLEKLASREISQQEAERLLNEAGAPIPESPPPPPPQRSGCSRGCLVGCAAACLVTVVLVFLIPMLMLLLSILMPFLKRAHMP